MSAPVLLQPGLARLYKQARGNPLAGLQPLSVTAAVNNFELGYLRPLSLIYDRLEAGADMEIAVVGPKRRNSVAGLDYSIVIDDTAEDEAEAERHKKALAYCFANLTVRSAVEPDREGEVDALVANVMKAKFMRYSAHEIVWEPNGSDLTAQLIEAPPSMFECIYGPLRFCGPTGMIGYLDLDRDDWMVCTGGTIGMGLIIANTFSSLSLRDWIEYNEGFGLPGVHGETPAALGSEEFNNFVAGIDSMVARFKVVTGLGNKINVIETSSQGGAAYGELYEVMKKAKITLAMDSDLSTSSAHDSQGASVQEKSEFNRIKSDAKFVEGAINRRFTRLVIEKVFGAGTLPRAWFRLQLPSQMDDKVEIGKDTFLMSVGIPFSKAQLAEKYGHSLPKPGADMVTPPAQPGAVPEGQEDPATEVPAQPAPKAKAKSQAKTAKPKVAEQDNTYDPAQPRAKDGKWASGSGQPSHDFAKTVEWEDHKGKSHATDMKVAWDKSRVKEGRGGLVTAQLKFKDGRELAVHNRVDADGNRINDEWRWPGSLDHAKSVQEKGAVDTALNDHLDEHASVQESREAFADEMPNDLSPGMDFESWDDHEKYKVPAGEAAKDFSHNLLFEDDNGKPAISPITVKWDKSKLKEDGKGGLIVAHVQYEHGKATAMNRLSKDGELSNAWRWKSDGTGEHWNEGVATEEELSRRLADRPLKPEHVAAHEAFHQAVQDSADAVRVGDWRQAKSHLQTAMAIEKPYGDTWAKDYMEHLDNQHATEFSGSVRHYDNEARSNPRTRSKVKPAIDPDLHKALVADLEPLGKALASAWQDPGKLPDIDLGPVAKVLNHKALGEAMAGDFLISFFNGCGISESASKAILQAAASE